ncbi:MAG: hypothetical protein P8Z40_02035, partial [Chloroflexota bacterium]
LAVRSHFTLLHSHQVVLEDTSLTDFLTPEFGTKVLSDLGTYWVMLLKYVGWAGIALVALTVVWIVLSDRRRSLLFLAIPALAFIFPFFLIDRPTLAGRLPTRYLLYTVPPLTVLIALSFDIAHQQIARWRTWAASAAGVTALILVLNPMLRFDTILIASPEEAPLTPGDQGAYSFDTSRNAREVAGMVLDLWNEGGRRPIHIIISTFDADTYHAYIGPRVGSINTITDRYADLTLSMASWMADGERVFFIENHQMFPLNESAFGAQLVMLHEQPTAWGPVRLLQATGLDVEGPQADEIYRKLAPDPSVMTTDYDALAAALAQGTSDRTILVFPADDAPVLGERVQTPVERLSLPFWPPTDDRVRGELQKLNLGTDPTPIEVILVDETHTDPTRAVSLALNSTFYQTGSEWYGLLHRLSYVGGPAVPVFEPQDVQFEGGISLTRAAILDREARPGGVVRVVLSWQTPVVVQDSYAVFTHLVGEDGTLQAQYDSIPGGGLLPMTSWQPGEPVDDRFAIRLPPDLPAGTYTVQIGIYRPDNGLRLRVLAGSDTGPDYADLPQVVVAE